MPYVTCGTVQVTINKGAIRIRIAPSQDHAAEHKDKPYIVFIHTNRRYGAKRFPVQHRFRLATGVPEKELIKAAFRRTRLEVTLNKKSKIIGITIPATP
jgi:HSP20 family molecular chaperone IbpA